MRRFAAFLCDLFLATSASAVVWALVTRLLQIDIDAAGFILVFLVFYFSAFEAFYSGATPGKFCVEIRVVRCDGEPLTFFDVFCRAAIVLFAFPLLRLNVTFLLNVLAGGSISMLVNWLCTIAAVAFAEVALMIFSLSVSRGSQGFHDLALNTAVVAARSSNIRSLSAAQIAKVCSLSALLLAASVTLGYVFAGRLGTLLEQRGTDEGLRQFYPDFALASEGMLLDDVDSAQEFIERNGDRTPGCCYKLSEDDKKLISKGVMVLTTGRKEASVPKLDLPAEITQWTVDVTASGLWSRRFQESVARNAMRIMLANKEEALCAVDFVYTVSFGPINFSTTSRWFVVGFPFLRDPGLRVPVVVAANNTIGVGLALRD